MIHTLLDAVVGCTGSLAGAPFGAHERAAQAWRRTQQRRGMI
jgi:hypothetical protein